MNLALSIALWSVAIRKHAEADAIAVCRIFNFIQTVAILLSNRHTLGKLKAAVKFTLSSLYFSSLYSMLASSFVLSKLSSPRFCSFAKAFSHVNCIDGMSSMIEPHLSRAMSYVSFASLLSPNIIAAAESNKASSFSPNFSSVCARLVKIVPAVFSNFASSSV